MKNEALTLAKGVGVVVLGVLLANYVQTKWLSTSIAVPATKTA